MAKTKLVVHITYCCCCSLTIAAILIAIYSLIVYSVFLGTAASSIHRLNTGQSDREWSDAERALNQGLQFKDARGNIIVIDPYFGSLGLYMEEMKYTRGERYIPLVIDIIVYIAVLVGAIMILVALCTGIYWLLLLWLIAMILDIIRGIISCIVMFVFANTRTDSPQSRLTHIAVGIFFLGLQLFHISMCLVIFAKFQRMRNKEKAVDYRTVEKSEVGDRSILVDGSKVYPTLPSHYAYSTTDPQYRRDGYYQPRGQQPIGTPSSYNGQSNVGYYPQPLDAGSLPPQRHM